MCNVIRICSKSDKFQNILGLIPDHDFLRLIFYQDSLNPSLKGITPKKRGI